MFKIFESKLKKRVKILEGAIVDLWKVVVTLNKERNKRISLENVDKEPKNLHNINTKMSHTV